jgi:hypothetical protein
MVVMMAISSEASFSRGVVRSGSIPHSSRRSSSQRTDSSASCSAPPNLDTNSASDLALDASRTCPATEVPDLNSCLPRIHTSSRERGSRTYSLRIAAANPFVLPRNCSESLPFLIRFPHLSFATSLPMVIGLLPSAAQLSPFQLSAFPISAFPISAFSFPHFSFQLSPFQLY